jgi:5-methylcytosine-specific restriction endonuclease McrA
MSNKLPQPDSPELHKLVSTASTRAVYKVLYENQSAPLSMPEIRRQTGMDPEHQEHLNRRLRDLDSTFIIERSRDGVKTLYKLVSMRDEPLNTEGISKKLRSWVLRGQRCIQCGRTPAEDGVRLHVDHKIPQEWGGTNDPENLQPLCSECNEGKKNYYATYNEYAEQIKQAANYDEPHRRIGELLKAFKGDFVRPDVIEIVANSKQYQDDWQKRTRELRVLGWDIQIQRKKEAKRIVAYYAAKHWEPWPEGNIRAAIKAQELRKKQS